MISRRAFMGGLAGATAGIWMGIGPSQEVAVADTQQLTDGFTHPPDAARPWVYWFWINGNVTKEGVTADLEAMQRVGIGGAPDHGSKRRSHRHGSFRQRALARDVCFRLHGSMPAGTRNQHVQRGRLGRQRRTLDHS